METKRKWLQSYRRPFQHATFDFVDLMKIDWRAAFYCPNAADHITADGICIGHKLTQSFIVRPWEAAPDAALTPGTVLRSRLMVQEVGYRRSLLQLTSASTGGLPADELQQLAADMAAESEEEPDAPEASVAPFLSMTVDGADGKLLAAPACRPLLRSLGTTAPAIQLLPEVLWDVARDLCTHAKLSFEAEASLQHYSPLLHKFLEPHLTSTAVPDDVISFVDSLRKVGGCT